MFFSASDSIKDPTNNNMCRTTLMKHCHGAPFNAICSSKDRGLRFLSSGLAGSDDVKHCIEWFEFTCIFWLILYFLRARMRYHCAIIESSKLTRTRSSTFGEISGGCTSCWASRFSSYSSDRYEATLLHRFSLTFAIA